MNIYAYEWMLIGFIVVTLISKIEKDAPRHIWEFLIFSLLWPLLLAVWLCMRLFPLIRNGFKAVSENSDHSYSVLRNWLEK